MAIQDVIKRLIYQFMSTGADKVANDLAKVNTEQTKLAVNSEKTAKASLDLDKSFENLERRFDKTIRAQQEYQKVQDRVNAAVAQNPALQERANSVLAKAAEHFEKAGKSSSAYSTALGEARGAAVGLAAGIGPLGAVLGSFGPWGMAAAAGIGLVVNAITHLREAAGKMGDEAVKLGQFSDITGMTTTQVRGLTEAGQELGVGAEAITGALSKFTVNLEAARKGSGDLYEQLGDIDKQLAIQIGATRSTAEALDLLSKAYNATADATTKAALSRAAFGKGGLSVGSVLGVLGDAGGVDKYSKAAEEALGVTDDWTQSVRKLQNQIKDLKGDIETAKGGIFSKEVLEAELAVLRAEFEIIKKAREAKNEGGTFDLSKGIFPLQISQPAITGEAGRGGMIRDTEAHTRATQENEAAINANKLAVQEMARESANLVSALGGAATAAEKEQARIEALTVAFNNGKISAEAYGRALDFNPVIEAAKQTTEAMRQQNELSAAGYVKRYDGEKQLSDLEQATGKVEALRNQQRIADQQAYDKVIKEVGDTEAGREQAHARAAEVRKSYDQQILQAQDGIKDATVETANETIRAEEAIRGANSAAIEWQRNMLGVSDAAMQAAAASQQAAQAFQDSYRAANEAYYASPGATFGGIGRNFGGFDVKPGTQYTSDAGNPAYNRMFGQEPHVVSEQEQQWLDAEKTLTDSIGKLTDSTDSLNATNQELLSPYYTQDPRTSHIGFRSQGMANGGYVDVPGGSSANDNMLAMIPVASGERIYVDPMSVKRGTGGGTVINITAPMMFTGAVNRDQVGRTVYQTMQATARSIQAAQR